MTKLKIVSATVVGISYRVTTSTVEAMQQRTPLNCLLRRERNNEHDENAIKVLTVDSPWPEFHIGYIKRETASALAPQIDKGVIEFEECLLTEIAPKEGTLLLRFRLVKP